MTRVAAGHIGRDGLAIGDDPIDDAARDVFLDGAKVIGEGVAGGFAGLGHQIGDVDARGVRFGNGAGDFRNQQVRENAGVERAGTQEDQVGLLDGFDGSGERADAAGGKLEFLDRRAAGGDAGFAVDSAAVFERGNEVNVRKGGRKDAAANRQHFTADADGFGEIAGDVGERGLASQAAGTAAVIGDGDDRGEIGDGALGAGVLVGAADDEFLEAAEERGEAGAASESDDSEAAGKSLRFGGAFFHTGIRDGGTGFLLQKRI